MPDLMAHSLWLIYLAGFAIIGLALLFGGKPERYGAVILLLMLALQLSILAVMGDELYDELDPATLTSDIIGFAGFFAIMIPARREWPIAAVSLQTLALIGQFLQFSSEMADFAYVSFSAWPTMIILGLLAIATVSHQYRLFRSGDDPDWVPYRKYKEFRKLQERLDNLQ